MTHASIVARAKDAVYDVMPRSPTFLRLWKQLVAGRDYSSAEREDHALRRDPARLYELR